MKPTISLDQFAKTFKARIGNITAKTFDESVQKVYNSTTSIRKKTDVIIRNHIRQSAGMRIRGANIQNPKIGTDKRKTRHLWSSILNSWKGSPLKQTKAGVITTYTWSIYVGMDVNKQGNNTVTTEDGRDAPYAKYLNTRPRFSRYNGFIQEYYKTYKLRFGEYISDTVSNTLRLGRAGL